MIDEKLKIAVFVDYDNIEIGVKSTLGREFDIASVLEGLKERGEIVTKIAYANWGRQSGATRALTEHGVQMVQRDPSPRGDKNGADINLALDALEMAFTRDHINTFTIVSGDSDFMALVEKLKQYNKRVFIVGGKAFTSTILQRNCHEFISYESLIDTAPPRQHRGPQQQHRQQPSPRRGDALPLEQALPLVDRALNSLDRREVKAQLGLLKSTMLQLDSAFTERDYGVNAFSDFVHKLAEAGHIRLHRREGNYVVERVEAAAIAAPPALTHEDALPLLRSVLQANSDFVATGIPAKELAALFHAAHPGFNHQDYGFTEFDELLNLAQDKGLVRIQADPERGLRVFGGSELAVPPGTVHHEEPVSSPTQQTDAEPERMATEAVAGQPAPPPRTGRRRASRPRKAASGARRRTSRKPRQPAATPAAE